MAKFIATRSFKNVAQLAFEVGKDKDGKANVPPSVERGEEFHVGDTTDLAALSPQDQTRARHLLSHNMAIFVDDPANKGRLETLKKQLAEEAKQAQVAASKPQPITVEQLMAQVMKLSETVAALASKK